MALVRRLIFASAVSCVLAHAIVAEAGFVAVGSRSALGGTDNLDWGDVGPHASSFPQPVTIVSDDGLSVVVTTSVPLAPINRLDQNLIGGWRGNFALGDELIYTGGVPNITLDFPASTIAAGMQIQPATLIAAFTTRIEALDAGGAVLAFFDVTGASTNTEDNTAPFVGIAATLGDAFDKIRITNLTVMSYPGIAINQVDFTPSIGATPPPHDSVVVPPRPKTYVIPAGKASIAKKLRVTVVNADILPVPEPGGHAIQLDVTTADCPPGMAGTPDFGSYALGPSNVATVLAGTRRTALVPLTIASAAFTNFNRKAPTRCTLTFAASAGDSMDPTPENAVATVEINVIDKNDPEGTVRHGTLIKSIAPVRITLHDNTVTKTAKTKPVVINADILPAPETSFDTITVVAGAGDCPSGTIGVADYDPVVGGAQNFALLKGGKSQAGSLPLTINAAAFSSPNQKSPARCTAVLTASGPGGDSDGTNNVTSLVIDVIDGNDF